MRAPRARGLLATLIACSALGAGLARAEWSLTGDFEAGAQGSFQAEGEIPTRRLYLGADLKLRRDSAEGDERLGLDLAARGWLDRRTEADLRALNASWSKGIFSATAGFQQIAWGETFGVFIADLVNPRDYRDALFNELDWIRLPVAALILHLFPGEWRFQMVFTPVPRGDLFPEVWQGTRVEQPAAAGFEPEWGLRVGRLLESGLDLSIFYLSHRNRAPVLAAGMDASGAPVLRPVVDRVRTAGVGASLALETWTFRGDTVLQLDQPVQDPTSGAISRTTLSRTVLGADARLSEATDLGLQYHLDLWQAEQRHWLSARASRSFFAERLVPEVFAFAGVGNRDLWIQPRVAWHLTDQLTFALRADLILETARRLDAGSLELLQDEDRLFGWVSYRF